VSTDPPVLLAVAHGSREPRSDEVLQDLLALVRERQPTVPARLAYLDHSAPTVAAEVAGLLAGGARVVVVPLLLTAAMHSKSDLAGVVRAARADHPGAALAYARPLGPHPLLLAAVQRRLAAAGAGPADAVVLAAAGSADPDANAEVAGQARRLWEWRAGAGGAAPPVEPAFASATAPSVGEAVTRLRRLGHPAVSVAPYFLAPGRLPDLVAQQAGDARRAGVLGADDGVATLVVERYREALAGDLRMNCDTCRYRVAWPGRAGDVGAPQHPRPHPLDALR